MSIEGPRQRIDDDNLMGLEWHAARALGRKRDDGTPEFDGLDYEQMRAAVKSPRAKFREGNEMRRMLLKMIARIENVLTVEQQKLLDNLMEQRKQAVSVWFEKFPLKKGPSEAELMSAAEKWITGLPNNVLQGFIELCPDSAQLVVVPGGITVPELLKLVDSNKTFSWQLASKAWAHKFWDKVKSADWKIAITDGIEDLPFDPDIYYYPDTPDYKSVPRSNEQMVIEYERKFENKGLEMMPRYGYVPTMATRMASENVLDRKFWTVFKKVKGVAFLPLGNWNPYGHISLGRTGGHECYRGVRCRPWYEGKMEV